MAQKSKHYTSAVEAMKNLGIYKPEFEPTIEIYAQLMIQLKALEAKYKKSKYQFEVPTSTGAKKAPIVTTLETLRKDILVYANALGLTPLGLVKFNDKAFEVRKTSALDKALAEMQKLG